MHRKIFLSLCILTGVFCYAVEDSLIITKANGIKIAVKLEERPITTIVDNQLSITTDQLAYIFPISEVRNFTYGKSENSGIAQIKISQSENSFKLSGLNKGDKIRIYDLQGILMNELIFSSDDDCDLGIYLQNPGIYVLNINNQSFKITRK